jgi:DNA-binding FadR family transcriptional regulator
MATSAIGHPVRAPKTADLIATQIRGQIVRGDLAAGDTLPPETDLMHQFGVSRPTLREAFRILETESLLQVRRGSRGGAQVTAPQLAVAARYVGLILQIQGATIGDVYEARMVLEPTCARLLAERRTTKDIAALRGAIDDLRHMVDAGPTDVVQWSLLTYRFPELIVKGSGNMTLAIQGGVLQDIAATHVASTVARTFDQKITPERFQLLLRSYSRLVDLVEAEDSDGAETHWRKHMQAAAKSLVEDVRYQAVVELFKEPILGIH